MYKSFNYTLKRYILKEVCTFLGTKVIASRLDFNVKDVEVACLIKMYLNTNFIPLFIDENKKMSLFP